MSSRQIILIALLLIAAGLAALAVAAAVLGSEAVMSDAQRIRMVAAANISGLLFLLVQIPIVWLILTSLWTYHRLLQIPLSLSASVVTSLLCCRSIASHFPEWIVFSREPTHKKLKV